MSCYPTPKYRPTQESRWERINQYLDLPDWYVSGVSYTHCRLNSFQVGRLQSAHLTLRGATLSGVRSFEMLQKAKGFFADR